MRCYYCDRTIGVDEEQEMIAGKRTCKDCYVNAYESAQGEVPRRTSEKLFYTLLILGFAAKLAQLLYTYLTSG